MFLMGTANLFGFIITYEQLPQTIASMILQWTDNVTLVMLIVMVILLIMGTFLDNVAALVIFVPTMMGVVHTLKIDDIYFGVFTIIALAVGQFTPPVGLNLFIAANIAEVSFESVVKKIVPYLLAYIALLIVFIFVPGILTIFN